FKGNVSWYTINLDLLPYKRWNQLISEKKAELNSLIQVIKDFVNAFVPSGELVKLVDKDLRYTLALEQAADNTLRI
ncbi:UNVERIFIED_CONTAM: hypothetical protein FKN15_010776, partial [Acipenser sinensis]